MSSQFFWDVTVTGMVETELKDWLAKQTDLPPKSGSVFAHNDAIQLAAVVPDLKADDHSKDAALLKSHIVSSTGWPGTWFDDPGGAGRAVGAEMAEPALRNIVNLQEQVRQLLSVEIDYHLASLAKKGLLTPPSETSWGYTLSFNKPSARDIQKVGPALARLVDYVTKSHAANLITQEEARQIIVSQANQLGIADTKLSMELPNELRQQAEDQKALAVDAQRAALATGKKPKAGTAKESQEESQPILTPPLAKVLWGLGTY